MTGKWRLWFSAVVLGATFGAHLAALGFSPAEANRYADTFTSSFFEVNGNSGHIRDRQSGGIAYFWGQAEMIECVIDAYEWTGDPKYRAMITNLLNGFTRDNGSNWSGNIYNDDIFWAVIAFARGGVLTGNSSYTAIAKSNFDLCFARAWDDKLGGGLYWTTDKAEKNACVNGPGSIAAYLMYQIYGDMAYWTKASNAYFWERSVLFNTNTGAIYDNIGTNGVISTWASTYNQGTFIGAANFLGQTNDATLAAHYTMTRLSSSGGILPEYGIDGNNSGFNAIFLRWMKRFMNQRGLQAVYRPWLQRNATAAWNIRRGSDHLSWCQWERATPAGTNFFAWDCISSFEALLAAEPTQANSAMPYPPDVTGYWPLDATSGTVAADASGNGNAGVVSGTWSPLGKLDGCLNFNGLNNSVQLTNRIGTDFSIAFWVKTTQASSSGQWYQGKALIDGDAPYTKNDFGTALVGGKFAFGIGNPDTTIVSTSSVNDGQWHHCVATRQRATGRIRVYVDGIEQASAQVHKNTLNASSRLLLGAFASGGGYFNGSLDEVRIFSRCLAGNEVAALYYSNVLPPPTAPVGVRATPGNMKVEIVWGDAPAATRYTIKRAQASGGPYQVIGNVTTTTFTDTAVANNRTYFYVVSAANRAGQGPDSVQASASPSALALWLKPEALSQLSTGARISVWPDSSGRNYDAIQTVAANRPTYVASAINGGPAVRFNAAQNSFLWFYRPVADDFTIIFVFQSTQGLGTGTEFYHGAGLISGECYGGANDFGVALNSYGQILAGTGNPDRTARSGTAFKDGRPHIVTFKRTKASGTIALYVDGTLVSSGSAGTQSLNSPSLLTLGAHQPFSDFFTGDIGEVQVYSAALNDTDRLAQEKTLRCKFGMTGGMSPAAPAGVTAMAGTRRVSLSWVLSPGATSYAVWRSTNGAASFEMRENGITTSSYVDIDPVLGGINYYRIISANACGTGLPSATASAYLPLPGLQMSISGSELALRWPDWADAWTLQSCTNLAAPTWGPLTNPVTKSDGYFQIRIPLSNTMEFYRLISQ